MQINFHPDHFYDIIRKEGHLYVRLQAIHENSPIEGTDMPLLIDTGAYITVLNRGTARTCGFDKLPKKPAYIRGFSGKEPADLVYIQGLRILDKIMTNVSVLIPHAMNSIDPDTKTKRPFQEVLGLNVLEYFDYFISSSKDKLYMKWNPKPRPYNKALACGEIYTIKPGF